MPFGMRALAAAVSVWLLTFFYGVAIAAPGDVLYARPGQRVAAQGTRLNFYCTGTGSRTVVFDSGWGDWAPVWMIVQPEVAKWARACSYDRAGAGFSDPGAMPRTSTQIAEELRSALHNAGLPGPYILVGNAFGGNNVRTFAALYPAEVAGLVLVEADVVSSPEELQGHARLVQRMRECRAAIAAGKPLPQKPAQDGGAAVSCAQTFFFRGLPEAMWSPELNAKLLELATTKVAMYDSYISEMEQVPADERYLAEHRASLGARPVRVLTTGNHGVHTFDPSQPPDPEHKKYEDEVARQQAEWLQLSSNSKQLFTSKSSEYIPFDQPGLVVDAIREVYAQSK
jgi:pimeloyl-ACP methyl ester carboxylesterase